MIILAYQKRVLALESQLSDIKREIFRLYRQIRFNPHSVDKAAVKFQLDALDKLAKLNKDQCAFYLKLGELYDIAKITDGFFEELERRDPELLQKILDLMPDITKLDEEEVKVRDSFRELAEGVDN